MAICLKMKSRSSRSRGRSAKSPTTARRTTHNSKTNIGQRCSRTKLKRSAGWASLSAFRARQVVITRNFQKYFFQRSPYRIHADNLPAKAPNALQCQTLISRWHREPYDSVLGEAASESGRSNSTSDDLRALTRLQEVGC